MLCSRRGDRSKVALAVMGRYRLVLGNLARRLERCDTHKCALYLRAELGMYTWDSWSLVAGRCWCCEYARPKSCRLHSSLRIDVDDDDSNSN